MVSELAVFNKFGEYPEGILEVLELDGYFPRITQFSNKELVDWLQDFGIEHGYSVHVEEFGNLLGVIVYSADKFSLVVEDIRPADWPVGSYADRFPIHGKDTKLVLEELIQHGKMTYLRTVDGRNANSPDAAVSVERMLKAMAAARNSG